LYRTTVVVNKDEYKNTFNEIIAISLTLFIFVVVLAMCGQPRLKRESTLLLLLFYPITVLSPLHKNYTLRQKSSKSSILFHFSLTTA